MCVNMFRSYNTNIILSLDHTLTNVLKHIYKLDYFNNKITIIKYY